MLRILAFHIFSIFSRKNVGTNELKNLNLFLEVTDIFVFSIQLLFDISRHYFRVLHFWYTQKKTLSLGVEGQLNTIADCHILIEKITILHKMFKISLRN